jgi:hypothetical protein
MELRARFWSDLLMQCLSPLLIEVIFDLAIDRYGTGFGGHLVVCWDRVSGDEFTASSERGNPTAATSRCVPPALM